MNGIATRLRWTDPPYRWHFNDSEEMFVVLDGQMRIHYRSEGQVLERLLDCGDLLYASRGNEHVAHPVGVARVLVIETAGSV